MMACPLRLVGVVSLGVTFFFAGAVALVLAGSATTALADDGAEPLYVLQNGKRVPTVIIPPTRASAAAAARPQLEVVDVGAEDDWINADADEMPGSQMPVAGTPGAAPNGSAVPGDADAQRSRMNGRRSVIGRYAGYPISLPIGGAAWDWGYGGYPPEGTARALDEIYRVNESALQRERERRFNIRDMRQRKERVLASHERALHLGLDHMKRGDYAQASIALQMAAELNQGDPACRIHLAQAQLALGHYEEAGQAVRRAFELQPKLIYVALNLASYDAQPGDFDAQVDKLAAWTHEHNASTNIYLLLGYMEFQRQRLDDAYVAFRAAAKLSPKDGLVQSFLKLTKPATN